MEPEVNRLSRTLREMYAAREALRQNDIARVAMELQQVSWSPMLEADREIRSIVEGLSRLPELAMKPLSDTISQSLNEAIETMLNGPRELARSLEVLREPAHLIGRFDLRGASDEATDEAGEGAEDTKQIELPEEIRERLIQVEHIPLRVIDAIHQDPRLMYGISPRRFEELVAELLSGLGFENVELTPRSNDGGRDVIAVRRIHGIPVLLNMECKRNSEGRKIGPATLRALLGTVNAGATQSAMGVLVTTSTFTPKAREFYVSEPRLDGKDFDDVVKWVTAYLRTRRS